jgi:RNA polymerase sigma factor (sigma-70 family)
VPATASRWWHSGNQVSRPAQEVVVGSKREGTSKISWNAELSLSGYSAGGDERLPAVARCVPDWCILKTPIVESVMSNNSHDRGPVSVVTGNGHSGAESQSSPAGTPKRMAHELDWTVFMARAQGGDKDAYRRLLESVAPYLRSLAARRFHGRADIEDAVQDVLLTVHAIRHTYDPDRPFGPWLTAIANRRIVDCLRRHGRSRARETPLEAGHETFAAPEANLQEQASDGRVLREAVAELPPGQRDAVRLLKLEGLSLKEAAAASGMSVAALKVATHRALKNLRKKLGIQDKGT